MLNNQFRKMIMNKSISFVSLMPLLAACSTFAPQMVTLNPKASVTQSTAGLGKVVALKVIDARADKALGYRTTRSDKDSAIITNQNVAKVVQSKIYDSLKKSGFDVDILDNGARALKIEIRELDYSVPTGSWTGGIRILATLNAVVKNGDTTYENLYQITNNERVILKPDREKNEELINKTLSDILQRLLQDEKVIALLAK